MISEIKEGGMANSSLGRILKERRKVRGLTLGQLSAMSGVSASGLGRIEKGERSPSAHVLRKIAKPLGFAETELFKLAGFMSWDESDDRVERFKKEIKADLDSLYKKIDSF